MHEVQVDFSDLDLSLVAQYLSLPVAVLMFIGSPCTINKTRMARNVEMLHHVLIISFLS